MLHICRYDGEGKTGLSGHKAYLAYIREPVFFEFFFECLFKKVKIRRFFLCFGGYVLKKEKLSHCFNIERISHYGHMIFFEEYSERILNFDMFLWGKLEFVRRIS